METVNSNSVLVVRTDINEHTDHIAIRDYILESIGLGVLILGRNDVYEIVEMPPLGGVEVLPMEQEAPPLGEELQQPEAGTSSDPEDTVFREHDLTEGAEKRAILQRLKDYRAAHGLGTLNVVAAKTRTKGRINVTTLQMLLTGDVQLPIEDWRIIGQALERLEQKEIHN